MKKIIAIGLVLLMSIAVAAGAGGGWYYYGRWVDTQSTFVPVKEPITVTTIEDSIPDWVYPGDVFTLEYEVTNSNENSSYDMTDTFYGNWEVVKDCTITVGCAESVSPVNQEFIVVFEKTFTLESTVKTSGIKATGMEAMDIKATEMAGAGMSNYCEVPYTIPDGGMCSISATVNVRNDAPAEGTCSDYLFWQYLHTYRGRDEIDAMG